MSGQAELSWAGVPVQRVLAGMHACVQELCGVVVHAAAEVRGSGALEALLLAVLAAGNHLNQVSALMVMMRAAGWTPCGAPTCLHCCNSNSAAHCSFLPCDLAHGGRHAER